MLTDAAKNTMLDAFAGAYGFLSLHTGYSATGANEVAGGSPAYARKAHTWNAAAAGNLDNSNAPVFDVPAGATIAWAGFWTLASGGTFGGMIPLGSDTPKRMSVDDIATNVIDCPAHGYTLNQPVVVFPDGGSIPGGLTAGTIYYVRDVLTDSFTLAATSGGAAIDITSIGHATVQKITPETFGAQGTYTVSDLDVALPA
ncbi:MAG: hypothetical protein C0498_01370 [Anaerolinea sp.]|nr:hypothetical protein [Anaerolinea sp.]